MVYDDFYSTIWIECNTQWEERLDGEGIIETNLHAQEHHYYDFPCCAMYGSEFVMKERFICMLFRALNLVVCNRHDINRDYFMHKYEDLHNFYVSLEVKLAYEINLVADRVGGISRLGLTSIVPKIQKIDMRGNCFF